MHTPMSAQPPTCKSCQTTVHLAPGEVQRLLTQYLASHPQPLADAATAAHRLRTCASCPDLTYGTTCRHCGCLVEIRTKLATHSCPAPSPRW